MTSFEQRMRDTTKSIQGRSGGDLTRQFIQQADRCLDTSGYGTGMRDQRVDPITGAESIQHFTNRFIDSLQRLTPKAKMEAGSSLEGDAQDWANKIKTSDIRNAFVNTKRDYAAHMSDHDKSEFNTISKDIINKFENNKLESCRRILQFKNSDNPMLKDFATAITETAYRRIEAQNARRNTE